MNPYIRVNRRELLYKNSRFNAFKQFIYSFHESVNFESMIKRMNGMHFKTHYELEKWLAQANIDKIYKVPLWKIINNKPVARLTNHQCQTICKLYYQKYLNNVINVYILQLNHYIIMSQLLVDLNWHHLIKCFSDDIFLQDNYEIKERLMYINQGLFRAHPVISCQTGQMVGAVSKL